MKAPLPESFLLIRGVNEHPLPRTSKASTRANRLKIRGPKYSTRTRLGRWMLFSSSDRNKASSVPAAELRAGDFQFQRRPATEIATSLLSVISGGDFAR